MELNHSLPIEMNSLPSELLRDICDNFKDKKATLKAVRLVNRVLANVAAPLLFQTLLVYQTPESWKNLSSIARREWLAPYVVKLELASLNYLPHCLDFMDWKSLTFVHRYVEYEEQNNRAAMVSLLVENSQTKRTRQLPNPGYRMKYTDWKQCPEVRRCNEQSDQCVVEDIASDLSERSEPPLAAMDSALGLAYRYQRYRYWHDGENELSDLLSHPQASHLDSRSFPNLRMMSVLGAYDLWKDTNWPSARRNRKARETKDWMHVGGFVKGMQRNVLLNLTLQMLDNSAMKITRLELHKYSELLASSKFSIPPLKHLQELILEFPYHRNYQEGFTECDPWELTSWLRGADDLHTLIVLSQDPEEHSTVWYAWSGFFDIISFFHGVEWPKLRSIHFTETFIRPESLLQFLLEHRQSLESIRIERPIFPQKAWQSWESELFSVTFRSPDCRIDMTAEDYCFQSRYATKDWFKDLGWDWIDRDEWS